jgi:hypothetical protein
MRIWFVCDFFFFGGGESGRGNQRVGEREKESVRGVNFREVPYINV